MSLFKCYKKENTWAYRGHTEHEKIHLDYDIWSHLNPMGATQKAMDAQVPEAGERCQQPRSDHRIRQLLWSGFPVKQLMSQLLLWKQLIRGFTLWGVCTLWLNFLHLPELLPQLDSCSYPSAWAADNFSPLPGCLGSVKLTEIPYLGNSFNSEKHHRNTSFGWNMPQSNGGHWQTETHWDQ